MKNSVIISKGNKGEETKIMKVMKKRKWKLRRKSSVWR